MESGIQLVSYDAVTSVSRQYSKFRLHPSLSICLGLKDVTMKSLLDDIDGTLQGFLDDVLIYVAHYNGSEVW